MIVALVDAADLVLPAQIYAVDLAGAVDQRLFEMILLQIDEGRHLVAGFRQQVERIDEVIAEEDLAELPGHAHRDEFLADAEPVPDLERALGIADASRALADAVGVIKQHNRHTS